MQRNEFVEYEDERPTPNFDLVSSVIRYEDGEMDDDEVLDFFQYLVDTGLVWQLQGCYGRAAAALIEQGFIEAPWSD